MPRRWIVENRRWSATLGVVLAVALGLAAFIVTRELAADGPTQAQPAEQPSPEPGTTATPAPGVEEPPGPDVTPEPGATPDTSQPYWFMPYSNQDRMLPRYDTTVGGIRLGPTVEREPQTCDGEVTHAGFDAASGSPVAIDPSYLPEGAYRQEPTVGSGVYLCDGLPFAAWAEYSIPGDPSALNDVVSGEKTWFEVQHGGSVTIGRFYGGPAIESHIATERWTVVEFLGGTAVAGGPVIPEGFGESEVLIHRDGILTVVRGGDLTLEETIRVAEGLTY